ncbi:hypothetical protein [Candidatus Tokpelaia sp.]|uniref:hypothetical protein n=1 Tax=Candidatus Tokpelaia sp. TaxID=2233777 RepID=UPI0012399748|nr:hypothetical protein [Candidatus Tokpelaia sp.]
MGKSTGRRKIVFPVLSGGRTVLPAKIGVMRNTYKAFVPAGKQEMKFACFAAPLCPAGGAGGL